MGILLLENIPKARFYLLEGDCSPKPPAGCDSYVEAEWAFTALERHPGDFGLIDSPAKPRQDPTATTASFKVGYIGAIRASMLLGGGYPLECVFHGFKLAHYAHHQPPLTFP